MERDLFHPRHVYICTFEKGSIKNTYTYIKKEIEEYGKRPAKETYTSNG